VASKACIFCGGRPLTAEHLVPGWANEALSALIPRPPQSGMKWTLIHRRLKDGAPMGQTWSTDTVSLTSKCVCGPCNNGWMGDIEALAKPILEPLIRGEPTDLSRSDEATIAKWLGLKAIIDQNSHEPPPHHDEWLRAFYDDRCPPTAWHTRLGYYVGTEWTGSFAGVGIDFTQHHRLVPFAMKSPGFIFTAVLGHFIGQVVGGRRQGVIPMNTQYFIEIWPHPILRVAQYSVGPDRVSQRWPPERGLDDPLLLKCIADLSEPK